MRCSSARRFIRGTPAHRRAAPKGGGNHELRCAADRANEVDEVGGGCVRARWLNNPACKIRAIDNCDDGEEQEEERAHKLRLRARHTDARVSARAADVMAQRQA